MSSVLVPFEETELHLVADAAHEWLISTAEVAAGFGVAPQTVRMAKSRHAHELHAAKHWVFSQVTSSVTDRDAGPQAPLMWTKRGVIRLGFLITSERAKRFRDFAEDLVLAKIEAPRFVIPATLADALQLAADQARQIDQQTARIAELEPAAAFADTLSGTGNDYSLREAAQVLDRDPAIRTGRNRLLTTLKAIGWVDRTGQPYQGQVDNGRLVRKLSTWRDEQRIIHTEVTVRVTAKGLRALHERLGGVSTLALITQPPLAVGFPDGITA
jgi:anti-repressor protein